MKAWLEISDGERLPLARSCLIGRRKISGIFIDDKKISRSHALIQDYGAAGYWFIDLGSRNGCSHNGQRVRNAVRLANDDVIHIVTHEFVFRSDQRRRQQVSLSSLESTSVVEEQGDRFDAEQLTAAHHGVILLGKDSSIDSITPAASGWLAEYFPGSMKSCLPDKIDSWVRSQSLRGKGGQKRDSPPPVLTLNHENKTLQIRLEESNPEQQLLLLTEEQPIFSVDMLKTLGLTPRECEVLIWVAQGKSNPEIATILGVSHRTVEKHLEHIFEKLGVESRTAALFCVVDGLSAVG